MLLNPNHLSAKMEQHAKRMRELELEMIALDREIQDFLKQLGVTEAQLTAFVANRDNFTPQNWDQLQKEKNLLEELLLRDLKQIKDPRLTQQAMRNRHMSHHWIAVR